MRPRDGARHAEAEAYAAGVQVAGRIGAVEGREHPLQVVRRDSRAIVMDLSHRIAAGREKAHLHMGPVLGAVVDQVGEQPGQGQAVAMDIERRAVFDVHVAA